MQDMSVVVERLQKAYNRIKSPGTWCQRAAARDRRNQDAGDSSSSKIAVAWCLVGAVLSINGCDDTAKKVFRLLLKELGSSNLRNTSDLVDFNDAATTTHEDVLYLYRRAIAAIVWPNTTTA
jgi:hypothetical protein